MSRSVTTDGGDIRRQRSARPQATRAQSPLRAITVEEVHLGGRSCKAKARPWPPRGPRSPAEAWARDSFGSRSTNAYSRRSDTWQAC